MNEVRIGRKLSAVERFSGFHKGLSVPKIPRYHQGILKAF